METMSGEGRMRFALDIETDPGRRRHKGKIDRKGRRRPQLAKPCVRVGRNADFRETVLALQHIEKCAAASVARRRGSVSPTLADAEAEDPPAEDQEAHGPEQYTFTVGKAIA